jgi:two-component system, OmpR family, alkaline phosphatase synthesis response regulator PhoP
MNTRILLVEDEENLQEAIKLNLEMEGYEVEIADTGTKALKKTQEQRFNLIILDVMLPEMDGFAVCEKIRLSDMDTPILFLTAKDTSRDRVNGLKLGADDYLTKPFNLEELLLRARILIKHSVKGTKDEADLKSYRFGTNEINFVTYRAKGTDGQDIELTKKEITLLKLLIDRKDTVVSRQHILQYVWGYDVYPSTRTIDNFILSFRKYFEKDARHPEYFHSIRGVGYKFTV